jgi:ABC-type Fe3+-hydroxamate transport system substrate-binding protein
VRIVSLCPSLTELVFDLDRGIDLVGITEFCVHPAPRVDSIEKVGGTKTPRIARIIELAPDLVLLNDEENRLEDALALEAAGLTCLSSLPKNPGDTAEMVRSIGRALERTARAREIALDIERRALRVERAAESRSPVSFVYLIWREPWMTVNSDTFAHSLLSLAGGNNLFADRPDRYPTLAVSDLRQAHESVILLGSEPFPFGDSHAEELGSIVGVEPSRTLLVDGEYLSWYGSRTPDGIDYAEKVIERAERALAR